MQNAVKLQLGLKHFGCFAHTLNLVVEKALKVPLVKSTIDLVKTIVSFFKRSTQALEKLRRYQIQIGIAQPKRLLQEMPTRWNSTYFMLQRFIELEDALRATVGLLDTNLPTLSTDEWQICKDLCTALKPIQEVSQEMSGEKYVTGSQVIVFTRVLLNVYEKKIPQTLHPEVLNVVKYIIEELRARMGKIEYSGTFSICTLLDPRYKLQCFEDKTAAERAKKNLIDLVKSYINKKETQKMIISPQPSTSKEQEKDDLSIWSSINEMLGDEPTICSQAEAILEVQRYLDEKLLPIKNDRGHLQNPSYWWKNHQCIYPHLAQLYRKQCCAMGTSVSCERMFSKSGYIISDRRTRLSTEKVKQLMFLNVNM